MKNKYQLPPIPSAERTPLIEALLLIIEQQAHTIQRLEEDVQHLRDEVAILKGEKKRPIFKASKLDKETHADDGDNNDEDDKNTITTYIVNGKKMSKEAFKKFDKDKIKTIEIKKEVKKEK